MGHCLLFFHNDDGTSVVARSANAYTHNMYLLGPLLSFPFHLLSIQAKLPEQFKLDVIRKKLGEVITPTSVVLLQELERFNKLIKRMALSLSNLQKVGKWFNHVTKVSVKENGQEWGGLGIRQMLEFVLLCNWDNFS